jgi:hypothetical protein
MRSLRLLSATTILLSALALAQSTSQITPPIAYQASAPALSQPNAAAQTKIAADYGKLPLSFEANHGQIDPQVKFLSRTAAYSLFLTGDEAVLTLSTKTDRALQNKNRAVPWKSGPSGPRNPSEIEAGFSPSGRTSAIQKDAPRVLRMKLQDANATAKVTGVDEQPGTTNYFIGNDPAKWRTNVPTYAKIKYENIYNGIDLVYYGTEHQLEYDFIVAPGADPHRIAFNITGANKISQDIHGDLAFKMGDEEIRWHKPVVYQEKDGARQEIPAHYTITDKTRVGFELAKYDASKPLYIDPLIYSTYLGGNLDDAGNSIAVDNAGNAYVTGNTNSNNFPTKNPLQPANGGSSTAFVTKINAAGSALVYSTYLGGSGGDSSYGIAVDSAGNAYVTGFTASTNFPTKNPLQPANAGALDAFVAKIKDQHWFTPLIWAEATVTWGRASPQIARAMCTSAVRPARPISRSRTRCSLPMLVPLTPSWSRSTHRDRRWFTLPI